MATILKLADDRHAANVAACDELVARIKAAAYNEVFTRLKLAGCESRTPDELNNAGPALQVASLIEGAIADRAPRP